MANWKYTGTKLVAAAFKLKKSMKISMCSRYPEIWSLHVVGLQRTVKKCLSSLYGNAKVNDTQAYKFRIILTLLTCKLLSRHLDNEEIGEAHMLFVL